LTGNGEERREIAGRFLALCAAVVFLWTVFNKPFFFQDVRKTPTSFVNLRSIHSVYQIQISYPSENYERFRRIPESLPGTVFVVDGPPLWLNPAATFRRSKQKGGATGRAKPRNNRGVYQHRRRVRGDYGKSLLRRRGELVERSFAHCYDTGGMRRTHLRGHQNILKRQLVHVGAFNLSLILRQLLGAGTPREWRNRCGLLLLLVYFLLTRREARNWLYRSRISTSGVKSLASPRTRVRRWQCQKSAACTTGC
jgi:hypothetical protein